MEEIITTVLVSHPDLPAIIAFEPDGRFYPLEPISTIRSLVIRQQKIMCRSTIMREPDRRVVCQKVPSLTKATLESARWTGLNFDRRLSL